MSHKTSLWLNCWNFQYFKVKNTLITQVQSLAYYDKYVNHQENTNSCAISTVQYSHLLKLKKKSSKHTLHCPARNVTNIVLGHTTVNKWQNRDAIPWHKNKIYSACIVHSSNHKQTNHSTTCCGRNRHSYNLTKIHHWSSYSIFSIIIF